MCNMDFLTVDGGTNMLSQKFSEELAVYTA
jgi:hypothetical protein